MFDVQLFGLQPGGHHFVSLVFHAANAVLLFLFLSQLTGARWRSAMVAALFALHPLHVESVAWASERKDVLSTFFFVLSVWSYSRVRQSRAESRESSAQTDAPAVDARPSTLDWPALVFFACGLMSKPMLVTVPCVLLLLDFWPLGRLSLDKPNTWRPLLLEKVPFLILAALSSVVTFLVQQKGGSMKLVLPLSARCANAVAAYWRYLGKTFWPENLAIFYPHPDTRYPVSHQWSLGLIALAALMLVLVSIAVFSQHRRRPWLLVG